MNCSEKQEEPKTGSEMGTDHVQPSYIPAFQNANYTQYYPHFPGMPLGRTIPYSNFPLPFYTPPPKPKRQLNKFSIFEKLQAIERVNCGETKAHVARSINVAESTLRGWFKNGEKLRTLYETEEMPMQSPSKTLGEYSGSSMYSLPNKIPKREGEGGSSESSSQMHQAKTFNNYNYSWLEFFKNFESLPLQYFDTSLTQNPRIDEGVDLGRKFLRWMEERVLKGDKKFNIHLGHLEAFRGILTDIFRAPTVNIPPERKHIVGDDEDVKDEIMKVDSTLPRKHIVGDEEEEIRIKNEPLNSENDEDDDEDDEDEV